MKKTKYIIIEKNDEVTYKAKANKNKVVLKTSKSRVWSENARNKKIVTITDDQDLNIEVKANNLDFITTADVLSEIYLALKVYYETNTINVDDKLKLIKQ